MRVLIGIAAAILAATPAVAADGPWNGFHVGINAGGMWGDVTVTNSGAGVPPGPFEYHPHGALFGATAGYDFQAGAFVFGIEGDADYLNPNGSGYIPSSNPIYHQDLTLDDGLLADVTGRLGFALGRTLVYGKGGFAVFTGEALQATTKPGYDPTPTDGFTGWTAGGGLEQMLTNRISIRAEYLHFDFGKESGYQTSTVDDPPTPAGTEFPNEHKVTFDTVKVGLSLRF
jgi:outer membrane immunogenic protein